MFARRPVPSPIPIRLTVLILVALLGVGLSHAQVTPTVGLYWDPTYSQYEATVDTFPSILEGYLVLRGVPEGILGWELTADLDGEATYISWSPEGQGINAATYPNSFVYGLVEPRPDTPNGILLATTQVMISGPLPVTIQLEPYYRGGISGEMAYLSADDPDNLRIMETPNGTPAVAFVNPDAPWYQINPGGLLFGECPRNVTTVREIAVTNVGGGILELDVALGPDCTAFSLPGLNGPMGIPAGETRIIEVGFHPTDVTIYECSLIMGGIVPDVILRGEGRPPIVSWSRTHTVNFGTVVVGNSQYKSALVTNTGEAPIAIAPVIVDPIPGLSIVNDDDPGMLEPGETREVQLFYEPAAPESWNTSLDWGDVVEPTYLYGASRDPVTSWTINPEALAFYPTAVGEEREAKITIFNSGDTMVSGHASWQAGHEGFEIFSGEGAFNLPPGAKHYVWVRFAPANFLHYAGVIELGEGFQTVPITGEGAQYSEDCSITPAALDFGSRTVGFPVYRTFEVHNPGTTPLVVDPYLDSPHFEFSNSSPGARTLQPDQSAWYTVIFRPQWAGEHSAVVDAGTGACPDVTLFGRGIGNSVGCAVISDTLTFGPVMLGRSASQLVHVENTGDVTFDLDPLPTNPQFTVTGGLRQLPSGQSTSFLVTYTPTEAGTVDATLALGGPCDTVVLHGNAVTGFQPWENQVGIYFDQNYTQSEIHTDAPNQEITGYLVMHNPSEATGVGAWELEARLTGPGAIMGWEFEGNYINVGSYNELIVGIGGTPLLPDDSGAVLLATVSILVMEPFPTEVTLQLGPIYNATIPGLMAWIPFHDAEMVIPMLPSSGIETVSWINYQALATQDIPAPLANLQDRTVTLRWPRPADGSDGFHVYRRVGESTAERLTALPLRGNDTEFVYADQVDAFAPGTALFYSYALLEGSTETLRSPETRVTVGGVPVLASRLLPNVPNPFNPSTEVHFEVQAPGRVRVSVYGLDGRHVRTIVDDHLAAGPHHRVWDGRDDSGRQASSGAYYLRLETADKVDHRKMMLLK